MVVLITVAVILAIAALVLVSLSLRTVQQYEKGVVFRFGRLLPGMRGPGLRLIRPIGDRMRKVSVQTEVLGVATQGAITADNVTVTVDAVVYFRVIDPVKALVNVNNYPHAVSQIAQTSLRSVIGRADLDTLLSDRDQINAELKQVMDAPTEEPWGLRIERVEIKDIALPDQMMRSMSKQAEAERERRARVIAADGEFQASQKLSEAAAVMADTPGALQLRLLQTVVDVSAEKNSTLVMPFPVEMLRFFETQSRPVPPLAETYRGLAPSDAELLQALLHPVPVQDGFESTLPMLPSQAQPVGELGKARLRADVARTRAATWPALNSPDEPLTRI
ncbi:SPFH domain-containing protein [Streptacidiphilus melanogenes]|uniref:SPFH domain-containing protein n=1 Tax=Streptacidiphilus melanogenes TaxID=411235 RepID=UPI000A01977B|nr:SPFH domain-containing protein [Streptacidiphilus melanogenes]